MNFEMAMLRAGIGFKVRRPGHPYVTGTGQNEENEWPFVTMVGGEYEMWESTQEDRDATDWSELA